MKEELCGSWHLESSEWTDAHGPVEPEGGHYTNALLMYDRSGSVSVQMMRPGKPRFASDDWREASPEEKAQAWGDYFCYFGTFRVDAANNSMFFTA